MITNTQSTFSNIFMIAYVGIFLAVGLLLVGACSPDPSFTALIAVFALSSFAGQQVSVCVWVHVCECMCVCIRLRNFM